MLERRNRRLELAALLLLASPLPQLLELGILVGILRRRLCRCAPSFVERLAQPRFGNTGRHRERSSRAKNFYSRSVVSGERVRSVSDRMRTSLGHVLEGLQGTNLDDLARGLGLE